MRCYILHFQIRGGCMNPTNLLSGPELLSFFLFCWKHSLAVKDTQMPQFQSKPTDCVWSLPGLLSSFCIATAWAGQGLPSAPHPPSPPRAERSTSLCSKLDSLDASPGDHKAPFRALCPLVTRHVENKRALFGDASNV